MIMKYASLSDLKESTNNLELLDIVVALEIAVPLDVLEQEEGLFRFVKYKLKQYRSYAAVDYDRHQY